MVFRCSPLDGISIYYLPLMICALLSSNKRLNEVNEIESDSFTRLLAPHNYY